MNGKVYKEICRTGKGLKRMYDTEKVKRSTR